MKFLACAGAFPGAGLDAARAQEAAAQDVVVVTAIADAAAAREVLARPLRVAIPHDMLAKDSGILASEIAGAVRAGAAEVALDARALIESAEKIEILGRVLEAVRPAAGKARIVLDLAAPFAPPLLDMIEEFAADVLHLDAGDAALADWLAARGSKKILSLGLVSGAAEEEEAPDRLAPIAARLLARASGGEAYLATRRGLEDCTPERARACALALAVLRDRLSGARSRSAAPRKKKRT